MGTAQRIALTSGLLLGTAGAWLLVSHAHTGDEGLRGGLGLALINAALGSAFWFRPLARPSVKIAMPLAWGVIRTGGQLGAMLVLLPSTESVARGEFVFWWMGAFVILQALEIVLLHKIPPQRIMSR